MNARSELRHAAVVSSFTFRPNRRLVDRFSAPRDKRPGRSWSTTTGNRTRGSQLNHRRPTLLCRRTMRAGCDYLRRQLSMMQTQLAMTIGAQVKQSSISGSLEIERPRQYSGEGLNNCVAERYWARKYGLSFLRRLSNRSNFQRTTWRIA